MATKKATPSWSDVKARLADFDRPGLLELAPDLYAASKGNQMFLQMIDEFQGFRRVTRHRHLR